VTPREVDPAGPRVNRYDYRQGEVVETVEHELSPTSGRPPATLVRRANTAPVALSPGSATCAAAHRMPAASDRRTSRFGTQRRGARSQIGIRAGSLLAPGLIEAKTLLPHENRCSVSRSQSGVRPWAASQSGSGGTICSTSTTSPSGPVTWKRRWPQPSVAMERTKSRPASRSRRSSASTRRPQGRPAACRRRACLGARQETMRGRVARSRG
jgi:hypothetical protein